MFGLRTGEFVDQAQMRHVVGENGSDYLCVPLQRGVPA